MPGPSSYLISKPFRDCWTFPFQGIGCSIERLSSRPGVYRWAVRRSGARVTIAFGKEEMLLLVFSSLLTRRGRNFSLAAEIERTLLASGAKAYRETLSTNLIYRVFEHPNREWLTHLNSEAIEVRFPHNAQSIQHEAQYASGKFVVESYSINFWTGPAIDPETKRRAHYVALDANTASRAFPNPELPLKLLDAALSRNSASRLEVQLQMDALKKKSWKQWGQI